MVKSMGRIIGRAQVVPRLVLPAMRCGEAVVADRDSVIATATASQLQAHTVVPVGRIVDRGHLKQVEEVGWERQVTQAGISSASMVFASPVILSARRGWKMTNEGSIEIFNVAAVVDGALRIERCLAEKGSELQIPVIVVAELSAEMERELRARVSSTASESPRVEVRQKFGTTAPRIKIDTRWTTLTIESEPFIINTFRGYSAGILVQRDGGSTIEHLLAGAKSLSSQLEEIRAARGRLVGARVKIRKQDSAATSPYEIEVD